MWPSNTEETSDIIMQNVQGGMGCVRKRKMREIDECDIKEFGTPPIYSSEKTIASRHGS